MVPQRTRRKRRTRQQGGKAPWFVDPKKGYEVTQDMIKALKKPVNVKQAKRTVGSYKSQYQQYKRRGGTKGFNSWAIDKGYAKRDKTCRIQ